MLSGLNPRQLELGPAMVFIQDLDPNGAYDAYGVLSGVGAEYNVGFLGEGLLYQVTTEAANLTGAQTGNVPQDKVVIGGMVKVVLPFKQINGKNLSLGVPSAKYTINGTKTRVDFIVAVGESMRRTLSKRMRITKIKGIDGLSTDPIDTIIIPEISPAEGEVNFPFAGTSQREIVTNWYAWPDPNTGRWAYMGDEDA